jgi:hypothetical protein
MNIEVAESENGLRLKPRVRKQKQKQKITTGESSTSWRRYD